MSADEEDEVARISEAIVSHFAQYPEAADTLAGIQRWWVVPRLGEAPVPLVELALERLAAAGRVRRLELEDGRVVYAGAGGRGRRGGRRR